MNLKKYIQYFIRCRDIKELQGDIRSADNYLSRQRAKYEYYSYLEEKWNKGLLLRSERKKLLKALNIVHSIGAHGHFAEVLNKLEKEFGNTAQFMFYKTYQSYFNNDFRGMQEWNSRLAKNAMCLSATDRQTLWTNSSMAAHNSLEKEQERFYIVKLKELMKNHEYMCPEALCSLMSYYEDNQDEASIESLCEYIKSRRYVSWNVYLNSMDVIYHHNRITGKKRLNCQLVVDISNASKGFNLTDEERLSLELSKARFYIECQMEEWKHYSQTLFENRGKYLGYNWKIASEFMETYLLIRQQANDLFICDYDSDRAAEIEHDIESAINTFLPEMDNLFVVLPNDFLYVKLNILKCKANFQRILMRHCKNDATQASNKYFQILRRGIELCEVCKNGRKQLDEMIVYADELLTLNERVEEACKYHNRVDSVVKSLLQQRDYYFSCIKEPLQKSEAYIESSGYNPSLAYNMLIIAIIYDGLNDCKKAKFYLTKFNETNVHYRSFSLIIQKKYHDLELKYKTRELDDNLRLREKMDNINDLLSTNGLKEAAIRSSSIFESLKSKGFEANQTLEAGTLMTFLLLHAHLMLNTHHLDDCSRALDIAEQIKRKYHFPEFIEIRWRKIKVTMLFRKGDYNHAKPIIEHTLAHFNLFDYDKLLFYKFLGKIEVEESFPKFKITSLCEALGLAEKIGCIDSIASIYEDMGNMFSTRYPVLGISMIRRAENLHLNAGQEHEVLVSKMLRAQACIIYYETCRMHSGKDLSPFKDEAVRIINSIKECSITDKGHLAFFLRLKGLALRHIESLKRALDFYLEAKGYDEAEKTAHSICYVASEINNREELVQGANRYLEITKLIGKKDNIDHVQELVNLLKKWAFVKIDFPTVNLKNNGDRTLLDVLEDFAFKNELWAMDTTQVRQYFPMPQDEGKCFAVSTKSGTVELCPIGARPFVYYRGQSTRYIPSLPTLYRKKLSDAQRYQERLKYMEFRLLIESHPILDKYRGGFSYRFPDGEKQLPFHVNHLGLAQHYGIATELIDITSDMWVAAFFAATSYKGDDKYEVYDDEDGNGVIYVFDQKKSLNKTATPIGIQPFSRPGEQRGYCIKMGEGEDFENIATAIEFKHNKRVNELIFNMANCSLKLFPNDILKRKVDELNKLSSFSVAAKNRVREEFYSHTSDDEINGYCKELNISFSDEPVISFSEADMEDYRENLDKFETHIIDNVKVYPVYNLS